ncbi:MAG: MscL family protein [Nocardioidaceae bacterium]
MTGFKNFLLRGNLVEIAVAFIIAGAFATVVDSFTKLLLEIIAKIFGGTPDYSAWTIADVHVGSFLTAVIGFVILAAVVYFFVVVPYTKARAKFFPEEEAGTPEDIQLLTEIRDALTNKS